MMALGLWTYILTVTILTLTPGVDTLLIVRNTARGGWKDGALSSLGICSGLFVHASVSALGIAIILLQTAWVFSALKLAGACYLVWLGGSCFKKAIKGRGRPDVASHTSAQTFSAIRSLREGVLSNILNPKTVIFYMAFLPQFIDPSQSALSQSLFLASLHFVIAMVWQCTLALIVVYAKSAIGRPSISRLFDTVTGFLFVGLGLKLALGK
jgi:RhtB (resistance to homoserine/threonine) family protein